MPINDKVQELWPLVPLIGQNFLQLSAQNVSGASGITEGMWNKMHLNGP